MLTKILGKIGLPILVKFVSASLQRVNNPAAQKASGALGDVSAAIHNREIHYGDLRSATILLEKSGEFENSFTPAALQTAQDVMKQEFKSEDCFSRFWRPAFGYSVAISWFMSMGTICTVVLSGNPQAPEIIMALVETTSLWGIALGVLGLSVVKTSQEKPLTKSKSIFNKNYVQPQTFKEKNYGRNTFTIQTQNPDSSCQ